VSGVCLCIQCTLLLAHNLHSSAAARLLVIAQSASKHSISVWSQPLWYLQAYQRLLLLEKIMDENAKTAELLEQRERIQEQRKAANMAASLHR
jgi:hypothetical protein